MKTFITLLLFTMCLTHTYSQPENLKGSFLIGGSASFDFSKIKTDGGSNNHQYNFIEINFDPTISYFISNKINVGLSISSYLYFIRQTESGYVDENFSETYLSVFIRYYPVSKFFFNMDLGIGRSNNTYNEVIKVGSDLILGRVGMGYSWFVGERVILEPKLHYVYLKKRNTYIDNLFEIENNINFALSLMFVLNKNK